jgi:hypothetical protein
VRFEEVERLLSAEGGTPIARTLRQEEEAPGHDIEDEDSFDGYPDEVGGGVLEPSPDTDRRGGMGKASFNSTMPGYAASPSDPPPRVGFGDNGQDDDGLTLDIDDGPELDFVTGGNASTAPPQRSIELDMGSEDFDDVDDGWDL